MVGCVVGVLGALFLAGVARRVVFGRRWHRHGCHGGYRHGWHGPRGVGEERFARAAAEVVKRRLRIDEEQEPIVDHALRDARAALKELAAELSDTRAAVAGAFREEVVDDAALAAAFAKQDDAVARARREVVSAMKQIHAVLEPEQRARAAEWLASGKPTWA